MTKYLIVTHLRSAVVVSAICAAALLTTVRLASAQADFTLVSDALSGTAGGVIPLTFSVNLTNGVLPATLDGFGATFTAGDALAISIQPFLDFASNPSTPDPLPSGYTANGINFFVVDLLNAAPGTYAGTARLSFDTDGATLQTVERPFTVTIVASAAPEPETGVLGVVGGIGVLGGAAVRRRTHKLTYQGENRVILQ